MRERECVCVCACVYSVYVRQLEKGEKVWLGFKSYNKPVRIREDDKGVRRSKPKITNPAVLGNQWQRKQMRFNVQISSFETNVGASLWCRLYRCACVVLLEGGEGLEEFGQVNLRVAAGGQGFVRHFLQPPIHIFLSVPMLHTTWRRRKGRKSRVIIARAQWTMIQFLSCIKVDTTGYCDVCISN